MRLRGYEAARLQDRKAAGPQGWVLDVTHVGVFCTSRGFRIFTTDPFAKVYEARDAGNVALLEMLFSTSLVALVLSPRRLQIKNTKRGSVICELTFAASILAVRLNRKRLVVVLEDQIYLYDIQTMKLLYTIETSPNPVPICALSPSSDNCYLAYPLPQKSAATAFAVPAHAPPNSTHIAPTTGEVLIFDAVKLEAINVVEAHRSPLSCVTFNNEGTIMATASDKGTIIRVFSVPDAHKLYQFRRGSMPSRIFSLAFNITSSLLCVSSATETIHIFKLAAPQSGAYSSILPPIAATESKPAPSSLFSYAFSRRVSQGSDSGGYSPSARDISASETTAGDEDEDEDSDQSPTSMSNRKPNGTFMGLIRRTSQNVSSSLATTVGGYLPKGVAEIQLKSVVAMSPHSPQVMVVTNEGNFYVFAIDLAKGGEASLIKQYNYAETEGLSNAMAPEMLIIDGQHNGYRNLILPLALNDQLVQQAVSSIAGLHMWRNRPDVCYQADASRAQVIHKLKEASMVPQANKVFTLSTWMTLLVLLLGELALGGDHYIYLLRMMRSMRAHGIHDTSPEIMQFLHRQTDMLTLLAQPFLEDLDIAQISNNEATLENLLYESLENASSGSDQSTVNAVIDAARCCLEMFRDRVLFGEGRDTSKLEHVKQLVSHIHPCVAGGTSLVWIYFIAAAASTTTQDRIFFSGRLLDIYKVTGFANIPAGLSMLENLWKRQSGALSREGYQWTPSAGLQQGLPCIGVIQPPAQVDKPSEVFDVLVVGAGYTGLTAARDTSTAGLRTLILEGRDRIGGRTWTSNIDGYKYEMGGTWVHWFQPHTYRELSRYGMKDELVHSQDYTKKKNYFTFVTEYGRRNMSHEEERELFGRAIEKFVNVDGNLAKTIMPLPYKGQWSKEVLEYANMSVADRIEQIRPSISEDERHAIEAIVLVCSGGTRDNSSFLDFLRWWAAAGFNFEIFMDTVIVFKLKCGQSGFATKFFQEALGTGKLSYSFNTVVSEVESRNDNNLVHVRTSDGLKFSARRVISTVPLNVLNKVRFTPPLDPAKTEAATLKHVNLCVKLHAEVKDFERRSWGGITYPNNKLLQATADGTTPAGNTHCVFFGCEQNPLHPEENIDETLKAVHEFEPMQVERLVFHNWVKDEFAEGTWVWYRPGMEVKYLEALRKRQGPVLFANSDWAEGAWRSFIDGAIQEGTAAALVVKTELLQQPQGAQKPSKL
ncbi:hypothetical protein DV738_g5174, partial [Chaetothyriales sp. CBS 135597]